MYWKSIHTIRLSLKAVALMNKVAMWLLFRRASLIQIQITIQRMRSGSGRRLNDVFLGKLWIIAVVQTESDSLKQVEEEHTCAKFFVRGNTIKIFFILWARE